MWRARWRRGRLRREKKDRRDEDVSSTDVEACADTRAEAAARLSADLE